VRRVRRLVGLDTDSGPDALVSVATTTSQPVRAKLRCYLSRPGTAEPWTDADAFGSDGSSLHIEPGRAPVDRLPIRGPAHRQQLGTLRHHVNWIDGNKVSTSEWGAQVTRVCGKGDGVRLRLYCIPPVPENARSAPVSPPAGRLTRPDFRTYSARPDC